MRTDEQLKAICDKLTLNYGDLHAAARDSGMSPAMLMAWMKDDDEAAKQIDNAQQIGWMALEGEAIRRATGYDEELVYKGELTGSKKKVYSDGLLTKVMEARIPQYKKGEGGAGGGGVAVQVNIMPRADNYDAWLEMKSSTLKQRAIDDAEAISDAAKGAYLLMKPPEEITLAEFTPVDKPLESLQGLLD